MDGIRHVEPVKQEPLLPVVEFPVVSQDREQAAVMPAERLVLLPVNIIPESV